MVESEFTEEQFIASFEVILSHISGKKLWVRRISNIKEAKEGYDGILMNNLKKIMYLQFKRSEYYPESINSKIKNDRNNSGFSKGIGFYTFTLLKKGNGKNCYNQHNLLWKLGLIPNCDVFYCAPIFHKMSSLRKFRFTYYSNEPNQESLRLNDSTIIFPLSFNVKYMLKNTIYIRPHKKITDNFIHRYSFDKYNNIMFHSNHEIINENTFLLYQYINDLLIKQKKQILQEDYIDFMSVYECLKNHSETIDVNIRSELCDYFNYLYGVDYQFDNFNKLLPEIKKIELWNILEYYLKDHYNILQYGIFSEDIDKTRHITGR